MRAALFGFKFLLGGVKLTVLLFSHSLYRALVLIVCLSLTGWDVSTGVEESEACFVVSPCVLADEVSWRYFVVMFLFGGVCLSPSRYVKKKYNGG